MYVQTHVYVCVHSVSQSVRAQVEQEIFTDSSLSRLFEILVLLSLPCSRVGG